MLFVRVCGGVVLLSFVLLKVCVLRLFVCFVVVLFAGFLLVRGQFWGGCLWFGVVLCVLLVLECAKLKVYQLFKLELLAPQETRSSLNTKGIIL